MAYHWRAGWMFERRENGDVRFWNDEEKVPPYTIPASEWASIMASVSKPGENAFSWETAMQFHQGFAPKP